MFILRRLIIAWIHKSWEKNIPVLKFMKSPFLNDLPHTPKTELYFYILYINTHTNTINLIQLKSIG